MIGYRKTQSSHPGLVVSGPTINAMTTSTHSKTVKALSAGMVEDEVVSLVEVCGATSEDEDEVLLDQADEEVTTTQTRGVGVRS